MLVLIMLALPAFFIPKVLYFRFFYYMEKNMLKTIEPAQIQPVTLEEIKTHLRLENCEEDSYLTHLIETATQYVEKYLNRSLINQKLQYTGIAKIRRDGLFELKLPRPDIVSINSVYEIRGEVGRFLLKRYYIIDADISPKLITWGQSQTLEVTYESGFGVYPKHVPAPIRHAIMQVAADIYENRGNEVLTKSEFFKDLLAPFQAKAL